MSQRKVKARLSKRGKSVLGSFCKHAQRMVDEVAVGKKNFPDNNVRRALRNLIGSLEENLEAVAEIANAVGDSEMVEIISDATDALAPADSNEHEEDEEHAEPESEQPESEQEEVILSESGDEPIDETVMA